MLYPLTINPSPSSDNNYVVSPGCLLSFTFDLEPGSIVDIVAIHVAATQDHSIRCWVSREPGDSSVIHHPVPVAFWHPNRNANEIIRVQDVDLPVGSNPTIRLEPGRYYINALNLINSVNQLRLILTNP